MNDKEAMSFVERLVKQNIKYKLEPPFSLEEGFNCYSWVMFIRNQITNELNELYRTFENFRALREEYVKTDINKPQYLDMPLFYLDTMGVRHIGIMLNDSLFTQCATSTNGVSINDINKQPWNRLLRGIYRHK